MIVSHLHPVFFMPIESLSTFNFRNLKQQSLHFHDQVNVICGPNGSGKTSLLEAVYSLTTGRSFRTQKLESIITHQDNSAPLDEFVLYGDLVGEQNRELSIGLRKSKFEKTKIKVDGDILASAAELAAICPTLVVEPESFNLLNGSSQRRRKFIDWGVFHVEHSFVSAWRYYSQCLKQRNALLKQLRDKRSDYTRQQISIWDKKLDHYGQLVDNCRRDYFHSLLETFVAKLACFDLPFNERLRISYRRGWDKTSTLFEALHKNLDKDVEKAYTSVGPHRMDVRITNGSISATETLSRGQQKLVVLALYISQIACLKTRTGRNALVLLDDLEAELDSNNCNIVFYELQKLSSQLICTSLQKQAFRQQLENTDNYKMFHVEHGQVTS